MWKVVATKNGWETRVLTYDFMQVAMMVADLLEDEGFDVSIEAA